MISSYIKDAQQASGFGYKNLTLPNCSQSSNFQFVILQEKVGTIECLKQAIYGGHQELHLKVTHSSNISINQSDLVRT
jgi:hypothetical protein